MINPVDGRTFLLQEMGQPNGCMCKLALQVYAEIMIRRFHPLLLGGKRLIITQFVCLIVLVSKNRIAPFSLSLVFSLFPASSFNDFAGDQSPVQRLIPRLCQFLQPE